MTYPYDIAIIGAGAGGLSLAAGASQMGAKVVLFEKSLMGGDCLNYGCVPSKSLLAAAKAIHSSQKWAAFGLKGTPPKADFAAVMAHVRRVIDTIAVHDSVERFEGLGVRVIREMASFKDSHTIIAGEHTIQARRIVISTGSSPLLPQKMLGLGEIPYLTNETIFQLQEAPQHLIVIGGGPIGCELAQAFALLGVQVTLLEGQYILPKDDRDCVAIVRDSLLESGVQLHEGVRVTKIAQEGKTIHVTGETQEQKAFTVKGSHILVATGRRPNVDGLGLEKVGILYDHTGIEVDKRLRTTNKKIYAIGDVASPLQFTHVANAQAGIVLKNILFQWPAKMETQAVPWVTYTVPELAHVGVTQQQVQAEGLDYVETLWPYKDNDRAQADCETLGHIKVLTDKKGRIKGVSIVGSHAGELLLPWIQAIREQKTLRTFTDTIVPYPTLSEMSKRVAGSFYAPKIFSKKIQKLVRILRVLG